LMIPSPLDKRITYPQSTAHQAFRGAFVMSRFVALLAAGCVAVSLALPSAALAFDRVLVKKGTPTNISGTVESMTAEVVKINVNSLVQEVPVNNIREVMYEEDDEDIKLIRSRVKGGQLEDALEKANAVNVAQLPRDFIKADVEFYKGFCAAKLAMAGSGDKAQAKALLGSFLVNHRNNYHYYEASETFGDLMVSMGDYGTATKAYAAVAQATFPDYKLRATVLEGRALAAQGQHPQAIAKFEAVIGAGGAAGDQAIEDQKMFAQIGKAASLAASGQAPQGIQIIEGIIEKGSPSETALFARAYNALGACYRASNTKDSQKAALMAYLHVDLLFPQDPEAHAEALYNLDQLWTGVGFPERATKARELLRNRYPGSRWVK
jgi:hypothetical protein